MVLFPLLFLSVVIAVVGLFNLTAETHGVGLICFGGYLAILARIRQAREKTRASIIRRCCSFSGPPPAVGLGERLLSY